jgi:hypothetical protein
MTTIGRDVNELAIRSGVWIEGLGLRLEGRAVHPPLAILESTRVEGCEARC